MAGKTADNTADNTADKIPKIPDKAILQSAATDSYSKAGAEMKLAGPPLAKQNAADNQLPEAVKTGTKSQKSR